MVSSHLHDKIFCITGLKNKHFHGAGLARVTSSPDGTLCLGLGAHPEQGCSFLWWHHLALKVSTHFPGVSSRRSIESFQFILVLLLVVLPFWRKSHCRTDFSMHCESCPTGDGSTLFYNTLHTWIPEVSGQVSPKINSYKYLIIFHE